MDVIEVTRSGSDVYSVTVTGGGSSTVHRVSADAAALSRLAGGHSDLEAIEASFRFLLDREPKESILTSFDLKVIARYFPEYEALLGTYLGPA